MSESSVQNRPVLSVAIQSIRSEDCAKLEQAFRNLVREDPTLRIGPVGTDGQTVILGMGELHLEALCERIRREHGIELQVGEPKVIYLETILKSAEAEGKYIRQTGERGQYAHVKIRLEPGERGSGYQFAHKLSEGAVPLEFVEPVNLAIQDAMRAGVLSGYEMVDLRAVLYDGSYHVQDSNEMAFKIAASMAFKEAARKASPVLLEPIMSIEVAVPEEFCGSIIGDLNSRRGRIETVEHRAGSLFINGRVPLAEILDYSTGLRSSTQGRATYSTHLARYEVAIPTDEPGGDEAGVPAHKPTRPKTGTGYAAASLNAKSG